LKGESEMREKEITKWGFIGVIVFMVMIITVNLLFDHGPIQEVRVIVQDLNGTIEKLDQIEVPGRFSPTGNLPNGLLEQARRVGKDNIFIGLVLRGKCNSIFCSKKTKEYLDKHRNHILWKEKMDEGMEDVWIFLKRGDRPDPQFLKVVN